MPPENLGYFHHQEKNGNKAFAGPEQSMRQSGKQLGSERNHWGWFGPLQLGRGGHAPGRWVGTRSG